MGLVDQAAPTYKHILTVAKILFGGAGQKSLRTLEVRSYIVEARCRTNPIPFEPGFHVQSIILLETFWQAIMMCLPFAKSSILDNSRAQARDVFANLIAATFL